MSRQTGLMNNQKPILPSLKDIRPICIEDWDSKIFASILNEAVIPILQRIVHPNQFCLKGRNIHMALYILEDIYMAHKNRRKDPGYAIFIDIASAYDNVDITYLTNQIEENIKDSNICLGLINYINSKTAYIKQAGTLYGSFRIKNGITQGSPLSAALFALYLNPLLMELEDSLPGLYSRGFKRPTVLLAYADDLVVLCGDKEEVNMALEIIDDFCRISGAKINKNKSALLNLSDLSCVPALGLSPPCKYLGLPYPYFGQEARRKIQLNILNSIQVTLESLKYTYLSIILKIKIINCFCIPKLIYYSSHCKFTKQFIGKINSLFGKFIWKGKIHLISRKKMLPHFNKGGLGLMDLKLFLEIIASNGFNHIVTYCEKNDFPIAFQPTDTPPPSSHLRDTRIWKLYNCYRMLHDDLPEKFGDSKLCYSLVRNFYYKGDSSHLVGASGISWIKMIKNTMLPPNILDFTTKLAFKSLPLNNFLIVRYKLQIDANCAFCNRDESIDHLFLNCMYLQDAYEWLDRISLCRLNDFSSVGNLIDSYIHNTSILRFITMFLFGIWKLRCFRLFQDLRIAPVTFLKMEFKKFYLFDQTYLKFDQVTSFWNTWPIFVNDLGLSI